MTPLLTVLALLLQSNLSTPVPSSGLPLEGRAAEDFLKHAEIVSVRPFETKGVTRPQKVELTEDGCSCYAVFKTIDEFTPSKKFADGGTELAFSDSYKYEIAAYELDKLLGLGMVPPAVERRIRGETGSLSLWVEGAITEWERIKVRDIHPPDVEAWNDQMFTVRLFLQLIYDTDYQNISNLLVTPDWKIYKIDSSRAFRTKKMLRREEALMRFSRSVLDALRRLTKDQLRMNLGPWLSKGQINSLWVRRGLILELADRRVAELGESAVLFD